MAFPSTPILDNFNRANEGPPPSADWLTDDYYTGFARRVSGNKCIANSVDGGGAIWNHDLGVDFEVYYTISNLDGSTNFIIRFLASDNQLNNTLTLTVVQDSGNINFNGLGPGDPPGSNVIAGSLSEGDAIGLSVIGSLIEVYYKPVSGAWGFVFDAAVPGDHLARTSSFVAIETYSPSAFAGTIDDFGGGTPITGPTADFSGTPGTGAAPLTVVFTDASTGSPTSWLWDFGDSTTSTDQNPTHIYSAIGTYTVALTATNTDGSDTETKTNYITVFGAPVADFSGTPLTGDVPLSVAFTDASTNSPSSWFWDFGDGGSSTSQNPTYIYAYTGVYTVTLTATNSAGSDSETKVAYITVTAVTEYGAAVIENCDIDTGGLAVGLRVANVAYARDNRLGSLTIDASAELRVKDNSYATLVLNGTLTSLAGDRSVWDTANFPNSHASDISGATYTYHNNPSIAPATAYTSTAINLALNNTHHHVKVTAAVTITLPTAASIAGHEYIIKATADSVLVNTTSSQTIDGDLTKTLNTNDCLVVFSDGSNWLIG